MAQQANSFELIQKLVTRNDNDRPTSKFRTPLGKSRGFEPIPAEIRRSSRRGEQPSNVPTAGGQEKRPAADGYNHVSTDAGNQVNPLESTETSKLERFRSFPVRCEGVILCRRTIQANGNRPPMQRIVFDEPYEFIPPYRGTFWSSLCRYLLKLYLKRTNGIVEHEIRGLDRLRASQAAGHSIILTPNHCRPSDPMVMGLLTVENHTHLHSMASWHVFKQDRFSAFMVRRLGAFSIYREGMDRAALNCAIDLLCEADRPLVIFPEGMISRTNDRLGVLMEGVAFIARSAARRRQKVEPDQKVVVHPVALKYKYLGDVEQAVKPVLDEIEHRLSWTSHPDRDPLTRVQQIGVALLCLKEIEYLGSPQRGPVFRRLRALIDKMLIPLEKEWLDGPQTADTVTRVKKLRAAILPDMVAGDIDELERQRRWRQLATCYLAQQLSLYPPDYVSVDTAPERLLETVERFEEDLTDRARVYPGMKVYIQIGEAIEVAPRVKRSEGGDDLMNQIAAGMQQMLDDFAAELDHPKLRLLNNQPTEADGQQSGQRPAEIDVQA